jgi:hypothetical protein
MPTHLQLGTHLGLSVIEPLSQSTELNFLRPLVVIMTMITIFVTSLSHSCGHTFQCPEMGVDAFLPLI